MTLTAFIRSFRYRAGSLIAPWRDVSDDLAPQGDCQDFARSVGEIATGGHFWWHVLTGRALIWRAWSPVNGKVPRHAVLWIKGVGWIDSTDRYWQDSPTPNKLAYPVGLPVLVALAVVVWNYGRFVGGWW